MTKKEEIVYLRRELAWRDEYLSLIMDAVEALLEGQNPPYQDSMGENLGTISNMIGSALLGPDEGQFPPSKPSSYWELFPCEMFESTTRG